MFFIAFTFKGQVHVFAVKTVQDKCNIEIFLSPALIISLSEAKNLFFMSGKAINEIYICTFFSLQEIK